MFSAPGITAVRSSNGCALISFPFQAPFVTRVMAPATSANDKTRLVRCKCPTGIPGSRKATHPLGDSPTGIALVVFSEMSWRRFRSSNQGFPLWKKLYLYSSEKWISCALVDFRADRPTIILKSFAILGVRPQLDMLVSAKINEFVVPG